MPFVDRTMIAERVWLTSQSSEYTNAWVFSLNDSFMNNLRSSDFKNLFFEELFGVQNLDWTFGHISLTTEDRYLVIYAHTDTWPVLAKLKYGENANVKFLLARIDCQFRRIIGG